MATLHSEMTEFKTKAFAQMPSAIASTVGDWNAALTASGIVGQSLQVGQTAPDFALPDAQGQIIRLADLRASGPVVITFYRGVWCPFCNMTLHAYQNILPDIKALGASFVAISPQTPDNSLTMVEKAELEYAVLSDLGNTVARQFGIVYKLGEAMYEAQTNAFGVDLEKFNGDTSRELPLPGAFVLDRDGVVRFGQVFVDVSERVEPSAILDTLRGLASASQTQ